MTPPGYSDRINHALAFAAKHHERQVHRGNRDPFRTHSANVAIILTRYDCDDDTIIAGILQDVVADCVDERLTSEMLEHRIGHKFGADVLRSILAITPRRVDASGVDLSNDERRNDLLDRLTDADSRARWVAAADALHIVGAALANLRRTIDADSVWTQLPLGRGMASWYQSLVDRFRTVGFTALIVDELSDAVQELSARAAA